MYPLPFSSGLTYAVVFWATYALWLVSEFVAARAKRSADRSRALDRGSLRLIFVLVWIGLTLAFSISFVFTRAAIQRHRSLVFFAGIGLMLAGIALRRYAMSVLGRYFTFDVAVQTGQAVVKAGPYRYVRHPSYTGALITQVGIGLALGNWASLLALLACTGTAYAYRISVEETALVTALGEPYEAYRRQTWRLIPFLF